MQQYKIIGKRPNGAIWEVIRSFTEKKKAQEYRDKLRELDEWSDWTIELEELTC